MFFCSKTFCRKNWKWNFHGMSSESEAFCNEKYGTQKRLDYYPCQIKVWTALKNRING